MNIPTPASETSNARARAGRNAARTIRTQMVQRKLFGAATFVNQILLAFQNDKETSHISPRLPLHTYLHAIVRRAPPHPLQELQQVLEKSFAAKVPIRRGTCEAIFESFTQAMPSDAISVGLVNRLKLHEPRRINLNFQSVQVPASRTAMRLLMLARQNHQPCTPEMYRSTIRKLLAQREYTAAALLYKETATVYHRRLILPHSISTCSDPAKREALEQELAFLTKENLYPDEELLAEICQNLVWQYPDITDLHKRLRTHDLCQGIAIIAGLLDRRVLPFENVFSVIRLIIQLPSPVDKDPETDIQVFVDTGVEGVLQKGLREYTREILTRIGKYLPQKQLKPPTEQYPAILPPLHPASLIELLRISHNVYQYHLMTECILRHMLYERRMPLTVEIARVLVVPQRPERWANLVTRKTRFLRPETIAQINELATQKHTPIPSAHEEKTMEVAFI